MYNISLTENEAQALALVLNSVGGSSDRSPRRDIDKVRDKLYTASEGKCHVPNDHAFQPNNDTLKFKDFEEIVVVARKPY